jgi:sterol desaturase/sphingolipid hydroxylase (fatty acid hydroxylase superfamily)
MFDNALLEWGSRVHPATPFVVYVPLLSGLLAWALHAGVTDGRHVAVWLPLGLVTWQLAEYGLHRYLFHWEGVGPLSRRFHEVLHGHHHDYPSDADRLVMPVGASLPAAALIASALWALDVPATTVPLYVGFMGGYLWYDLLHWATHAVKPRTAWGRRLRAHHMAHHFADPSRNFGISHRWVDLLVGTFRKHEGPGRP